MSYAYIPVEEIKQRNIANETFCKWIDELEKICREELRLLPHQVLKLDEVACLNDFKGGVSPYYTFREPHFNQ